MLLGGGGRQADDDNETVTLEPEGREDSPAIVATGVERWGAMESANKPRGSKLRLPCKAATTCVEEGTAPTLGEGTDPGERQGTAPGGSKVREEMAATVPVDDAATL